MFNKSDLIKLTFNHFRLAGSNKLIIKLKNSFLFIIALQINRTVQQKNILYGQPKSVMCIVSLNDGTLA
jgi:hypothetical protein